jgi:SAM-dependent methyltransferase
MIFSKWQLKAFVQKVISFLPYKERINYFFQKYITKGVRLSDEYFGLKLEHANDHIKFLNALSKESKDRPPPEKLIFELGTGWYPIIPLVFYLTKTGRVISADLQSWLRKKGIRETMDKFIEWNDSQKLKGFDFKIDPDRWSELSDMSENFERLSFSSIKERIGLKCIVGDARNLDITNKSIDFICSNNTFEHIPESVLEGILQEFIRILKKGGVMSHFIDMTDHFSHFDGSITLYHFLRFGKRKWRLIDNRIQPQNRMRFVQYQHLYDRLNIPWQEEKVNEGHPDLLSEIPIHKEFNRFTKSELSVTHGYLVTKL